MNFSGTSEQILVVFADFYIFVHIVSRFLLLFQVVTAVENELGWGFKEFFEKRKMQQRLKNLGITPPTSPRGTSCGSMDLLTLFVVNQIAAKKENKDPPKVAVLGSSKGWSKHKRNEALVLPMSPCSPSQLNLESQPQYSLQGTRQRKHVIPQGFKYRQLSPVFESAFSDNSASDYLPPITDPLSPFSFTSPASSGQGMFPLQPSLQHRSQTQAQLPPHCSPPPWGISGREQTKFQPFSQPRDMTGCLPWSNGSNPPLSHLEAPPAARVLFGSPKPDNTEARKHARQEVTFCLNQPEDREPMLDFTLNHSDTEADIFSGFNAEEYEREASHFGGRKQKICLNDETPAKSSAPQIVPDSQCMGVELSNCSDMNCSHLEHSGPMNGRDCSPSFSCRRGYLSSDSNNEEECCEPSLHDASSYMDQACCTDGLNSNIGSQGNPKQRHSQPRFSTPLLKPKMNFRDDQKVREEVAGPNKAVRSKTHQMGSHTTQFDSPQALAQSQPALTCECKKATSKTRDAGTQTANDPTAETCDASTQCSFAVDRATKPTGFNWCLPPVEVSAQHPATGRQSDTAAERNAHTPSPGKARSGGNHTPWNKKTPRAASLSGSLNKITANNDVGKVVIQRPVNPFQDALSMTYGRGISLN
uniref:uncharacterized protein LOC124053458 isoform X2 n=1 Tax=Scatophagus argus TaxID=75038 RepID=UPI001ED8147B|nr:uncharacterized protein LOC124053458 isoform X2 [Scatophagus argus]